MTLPTHPSGFSFQITTPSPEDTEKLGVEIGVYLEPGTVVYLTGDLGSGKTAFTRGLALGLGIPEDCHITSPTYTYINEYQGRVPFYHVDLYRAGIHTDLDDTGLFDIIHGNGVVVIEWADKLRDEPVPKRLTVYMEIIDDNTRKLNFIVYGLDSANLLERVEKFR